MLGQGETRGEGGRLWEGEGRGMFSVGNAEARERGRRGKLSVGNGVAREGGGGREAEWTGRFDVGNTEARRGGGGSASLALVILRRGREDEVQRRRRWQR